MKPPSVAPAPEEFLDWMHISITKQQETAAVCTYRFATTKYRIIGADRKGEPIGPALGLLQIHKQDGRVEVIDPMPGDTQNRIFMRAAQVVKRHWSHREYPEVTAYAAG